MTYNEYNEKLVNGWIKSVSEEMKVEPPASDICGLIMSFHAKLLNESRKTAKIKADQVVTEAISHMRYPSNYPGLSFCPWNKIDHSIQNILEYVNAGINFISNLIFDPKHFADKLISGYVRMYHIPSDIMSIIKDVYVSMICTKCKQIQNECKGCGIINERDPFQFDLSFALGRLIDNCQHEESEEEGEQDDDDSSDEFEEEQEDDYDSDEEEDYPSKEEDFKDYIGNIQAKLDNNKLNNTNIKRDKDSAFCASEFQSLLNKLIMQQNVDENASKYVSRKRFISMIDKRNGNDNDVIYMYNPPESIYTSDIPDPQPSLWGLSSICTCLLPPMDYDEDIAIGKTPWNEQNKEDITRHINIHGAPYAKSGVLTFSFQIKSNEEIKCYIWWNGQNMTYMRFIPNQIENVFSHIFNMDHDNNKEYLESKDFEDKLENIDTKLCDRKFDAFLTSCKYC